MTAVDRTVPLSTTEFGKRNPDRVHVVRGITLPSLTPARPWQVWRGTDALHAATTHAEAIRWAQANAHIGLHAYIGGRYVGQVGEVELPTPRPNRINLTYPEPTEAP